MNTELSQPINQALNYLDLIIQEKGCKFLLLLIIFIGCILINFISI